VAVKQQQSGKRERVFVPRPCSRCSQQITKIADGTPVRILAYSGGHRSSLWEWSHRRCLDTK
jgi:hypothetical protein